MTEVASGDAGENDPKTRKNLGSGFSSVMESLDAFKKIP